MDNNTPIPVSARNLLRAIDERDRGKGVLFGHAPRGRWVLPGTGYVVNSVTFHILVRNALIDVGNGHNDPVKITEAGREQVAVWFGRAKTDGVG